LLAPAAAWGGKPPQARQAQEQCLSLRPSVTTAVPVNAEALVPDPRGLLVAGERGGVHVVSRAGPDEESASGLVYTNSVVRPQSWIHMLATIDDGKMAFVTSDWPLYLGLIDLTTWEYPRFVAGFDRIPDPNGLSGSKEKDVDFSRSISLKGVASVAGALWVWSDGTVWVLDVSEPARPQLRAVLPVGLGDYGLLLSSSEHVVFGAGRGKVWVVSDGKSGPPALLGSFDAASIGAGEIAYGAKGEPNTNGEISLTGLARSPTEKREVFWATFGGREGEGTHLVEITLSAKGARLDERALLSGLQSLLAIDDEGRLYTTLNGRMLVWRRGKTGTLNLVDAIACTPSWFRAPVIYERADRSRWMAFPAQNRDILSFPLTKDRVSGPRSSSPSDGGTTAALEICATTTAVRSR
jgi:hypothetical protein